MKKTESRKTGGEPHLVNLGSVIPAVPKDEAKKLLIEDLIQIKCKVLLIHPWNLRSKGMVREFSQEYSNEWEGTIRRDPERGIVDLWAEVYNFLKERRGYASRNDKFASSKFSTPVNPNDGYAVADYEDLRERRVLEFIVLILYPEKPTRITETISNTIFRALSRARPVSWGVVM